MKNKENFSKEIFEKAYQYLNEKAGKFYVVSNCAIWQSDMVIAV